MSPFVGVPPATATPVAPALPLISIVPLPVQEELVLSAVLKIVSSAQRAVYASKDALESSQFELSFALDVPLPSASKCYCCRGVKAAVEVSRLLLRCDATVEVLRPPSRFSRLLPRCEAAVEVSRLLSNC
jgi:uroporphyrinogen-III synthase